MSQKTEIDAEASSPHTESMSKICPLLTMADAMRSRPPAASDEGTVAVPELTGVQCQGPSCGMYLPVTDEKNVVVGGLCSFRAQASFTSQMAAIGNNVFKTVAALSGGRVKLG